MRWSATPSLLIAHRLETESNSWKAGTSLAIVVDGPRG